MKKFIAFFAFLCLAAGTTGAKGFLNPEGSYTQIDTKKLEYSIPYIPVEKRSSILPKHNICSIAPAGEPSDYFITGNGSLTLRNRREGCRILVNGKELAKDGDHVQYTFKANETAQIEVIVPEQTVK